MNTSKSLGGNIVEEEKSLITVKAKSKWASVQKIIIYFFIYSCMGWMMEVIYAVFVQKQFVNRGFLFGPMCPIYGYGAVLLILTLSKVKNNKISKFLAAAISFSIFEYLVSYILELIFHQRWWDYSNDILNLQGRISILYSIVWGILGVIFIDELHPRIKNKVDKILQYLNKNVQLAIVVLLLIIWSADTVISTYMYLL